MASDNADCSLLCWPLVPGLPCSSDLQYTVLLLNYCLVLPENCDLAVCNLSTIWALLLEREIFAIQHNFWQLLLNCPYSLHTYRIVVIITPLHEIGCGMTPVVGWSLIITKADCDLSL